MTQRPVITNPMVIVIAGPNGAGKTTVAKEILAETVGVLEFVNADAIAQGLSAFDPERAAFAAGRVMLSRLDELAAERASFAFESTLSSRTFAPRLRDLASSGYEVHLVYVSLVSAALAKKRVRLRVRKGGHSISGDVIERRFLRSIRNLFAIYMPLSTTWRLFDNSTSRLRLVAWQSRADIINVLDPARLSQLKVLADADQDQSNDGK